MKRIFSTYGFWLVTMVLFSCGDESINMSAFPDKILFRQDGNLWIHDPNQMDNLKITTDSDGITRIQFTKNPWSPDNSKIIFSRLWSSHDGLYVINADGTGRKLLDSLGIGGEWSPDGKEIVYSRLTAVGEGMFDVYKIKVDGSDRTQLTSIDQTTGTFLPAWSSSGDKIAFRKKVNDEWQLWNMNIDGTDEMPLIESGTNTFAWSTKGDRLAVQLYPLDAGMVIINSDGIVSFTQPEVEHIFSWAPSGEHVAVKTADGLGVLSVNDKRVNLVKDYFDDTRVSHSLGHFSSDGEWMTFINRADSVANLDIWALHIESGKLIKMMDNATSPRCSNAMLK